MDSSDSIATSTYTTPASSQTTFNAYQLGNQIYGSATTTITGGETFVYNKPRTNLVIVMFHEKPSDQRMVLDAEFIQVSLKQKYNIVSE